MQPFDVIDAFDLSFYEGSAVKYILRWRRKGGVEDLHKARHFLEEVILRAEAEERLDREAEEATTYRCAYCHEPLGEAVFVVVGGGEVHESCAVTMMQTT
jgi:hypothetical protein